MSEVPGVEQFCQIIIRKLIKQINSPTNNILRKITTKQPKQLIIIQAISLMIVHLKDLPKTIQKANPIHSTLIKTPKRLQQNMLTTIRLQQVLRDALRGADGGFAQEDPG
jgi:hypothetical protein